MGFALTNHVYAVKIFNTYREQVNYWYSSHRWKRRARYQLKTHPLCEMCLKDGAITVARTVDHVVPHKGNINDFWLGSLQSLCLTHHNKSKQQLEVKGFTTDIGHDGFPSDPKHPFNRLERKR